MAKKRMFNIDVIDTDSFLDMPLSAQALYFWLSMRADDDGFISNPKRVKAYIGASDDDLKLLVAKRFVIAFDDGVIVIKHWRMHNTIRKDRYIPTHYQEDLKMLGIKENNSYTLDVNQMATNCQPLVSTDIDIGIGIDIDKNRLDTDTDIDIDKGIRAKKRSVFEKPTVNDIREYCIERNNNVDAERFFDFYESKGWMVGKNKMKDWKSAVRTWERGDGSRQEPVKKSNSISDELQALREKAMRNNG